MSDANLDPVMALESSCKERQKKIQMATETGLSEVQQFYDDTTIFITGGTGFIGKQLIEKLLRSCKKIKKVYILARIKKNKGPNERIEELCSESIFDEVRKLEPDFVKRIGVIEGDLMELNFGLSDKSLKIFSQEVNVIFHVAATTRFDEPLKRAVLTNVRATREAVNLAKSCKNLVSFVHVSTAYCHSYLPVTEEKFYPSPVDYKLIIDMAENMEEERFNRIASKLVEPWPNNYSFTKAIAESIIKEMGDNMPVAVVRPAVVTTTYFEPLPGWLDNSCIYGPTALLLSVGMGALHTFVANPDCRMDTIPVDFSNNAYIVAAAKTGKDFKMGIKETKVYTHTCGRRNCIMWGELIGYLEPLRWMATPKAYWYFHGTVQKNWYYHLFLSYLFHYIPAFLVDTLAPLFGKQTNVREVYKKLDKLISVLMQFSMKNIVFDENNMVALYEGLSEIDKQVFEFDIAHIDWNHYCSLWCIGVRKYLIKDGLKDTAIAVRRQKYFRIGHYIMVGLYIYVFYKILSIMYNIFMWALF